MRSNTAIGNLIRDSRESTQPEVQFGGILISCPMMCKTSEMNREGHPVILFGSLCWMLDLLGLGLSSV